MKQKIKLLFIAITGSTSILLAQAPKWIVGTSLLGFTNSFGPQVVSGSLGAAGFGRGANAGFGPSGDLLFYIRGGNIYNKDNVFVDSLNPPINILSKEISVVNVPGTCNEFYIIGMTQKGNCIGCKNYLFYARVAVNGTAVTVSQPEYLNFSGERAFAITKVRNNRTRLLFAVGSYSIERLLIDRNSISHQQTLPLYPVHDPSDVELFEDPASGNMRLAYGNGSVSLNIHTLDYNGNYLNSVSPGIPGLASVHGLEFIDYNRLILAQSNFNTALNGIAVFNILGMSTQYIPNTAEYLYSYVEKAPDGKFYTSREHIVSNVNQGYKLASINPNSLTVTEVPNLTLPNMDLAYSNARLLPDQVDNEDYIRANYRWDLAAFDNAADTGAEPYVPSSGNEIIWESNDLWNRKSINGLNITHENPGYSSDPSKYNVMRFRVRNIGCTASTESRVRLYWTMGATGETWDNNAVPVSPPLATALNSWDGSKCITNPQNNTCIPAGGEIKIKSQVFNSNAPDYDSSNPNTPGFIVPPLQPGEETVIDAKWKPVNPSLFGDPNIISNPILCFLGRIVDVNDPMFSELPASTTNMMGDNVKNNNNVVTHNTSLVPLGILEGSYYQYAASIFIGNPSMAHSDFVIRFDRHAANDNSFGKIGRIKITLDDILWEKWTTSGAEGKGIEIFNPEKHEILVTNFDNAQLGNISLGAGENRAIKFTFELREPTDLVQHYQYAVSQVETTKPDKPYGSVCTFNVKINHAQESGEELKEDVGKYIVNTGTSNFKDHIILSPNPSSDYAKLDFELLQGDRVNIQIVDIQGKVVKSIEKGTYYDKGKRSVKFSTSSLSEGNYFIVIESSGEKKSLQLMVKH